MPEVIATHQQVVYIDVLFVVNLAVNYFILLAVSGMLHRKDKRYRLFLGSCLGALYSCFVFFPSLNFLYISAAKFVFSVSIVIISFRFHSFRSLLKLMVCFYAVTVVFGGTMYALWYFFSPPGMIYRNGVVYFNLSPLLLILSGGLCYAVIELLSRFLHRGAQVQSFSRLTITVGDKSAEMNAMLDTGNNLCDMITGDPVLIVEYPCVEKLLPPSLRAAFRSGTIEDAETVARVGWTGRIRMLPFDSVGGPGGLLPAFRPDLVTAESGGRHISTQNALIAVCARKLSREGAYSALLSPHLFTEIRAD